jgi:hypothetical protein
LQFKYKSEASRYVGGLSRPEKMPGPAYSLEPLVTCTNGRRMRGKPGTVCSTCYGLSQSGRYFRFAKTMKRAWDRRYEATFKPHFVDAMIRLIEDEPYFRWHDTGDVYSVQYLGSIIAIAERLPGTRFWLPTGEYWIRNYPLPSNLVARYKVPIINPDQRTIDYWIRKYGTICTVSDGDSPARCSLTKKLSRDGKNYVSTCGECRRCWDSSEVWVDYKLHK